MKELMKEFLDFLDFIDSFVKKICILLTGIMAMTVTLQVLFRYILKNPLVWTEELSRYLLVWMAFIAASSLIKRSENVNVDYFLNKFPAKVRKTIQFIIKLVILVFLISIFIQSIIVLPKVSVNQVTPAMQISMLIPQFGIIIGLLLMALQMTGLLIADLSERGNNNA